jgi:hypothetical protein
MWRNTSLGAAAVALMMAAMGCAKGGAQTPGTGGSSDGGAGGTGGTGGIGGIGGMGGGTTSTGGGLPTSCVKGEECAPLTDACNQGACVNGMCAKLPDMARENAPCEDGLYCTQNDVCHNGTCEGGGQKVCPGADACNVGACDEATKSCATAPGNSGQKCPSDDLCKSNTTCNNGMCGGGQTKDCSIFDDLCTIGVCDSLVGCKPETKADGMACDGGQSNTCYDSVCVGGACQKVAKNDGASCNAGSSNPCVVGVCMGAVCQPQPANDGTLCDDGMFDPCTQGVCSLGACKPGIANDGKPCDDFLFCTVNDHCTTGICGGDPNTCGPANGCFVFQCNEALKVCSSVPGNDGAACDDGNACTAATTCAGGVCGTGTPTNEGGPCIASSCTSGDTCTAGVCGGGQGPTIYFQDDFKDSSKGWLLGPEWQIGPASLSSSGMNGDDPPNDHTPSADNGLAGVVIGGDESPVLHPYYYLESPAFDTSAAAGPVILGFYRWLNSDYEPYMHNRIEIYNGTQWIVIWQSGGLPGITDSPPTGTGWTYLSYDVTNYKNAAMKVRFGYDIGQSGVFTVGSWNVDDVLVASAVCP